MDINLPRRRSSKKGLTIKNYLFDREVEDLDLSPNFSYPGMVRIRTIADGSCFFHAVANAFFPTYREGVIHGKPISRAQIVHSLREDLAIRLARPVNQLDPNGPTNYDILNRGQLREHAKNVPYYSLEELQDALNELNEAIDIDDVYHEFISNQLGKDIYILSGDIDDVVYYENDDLLYKRRPSIVLYYLPGHYELVGLRNSSGAIETIFLPDSDFIQNIRQRMNERKGF